MKRSTSLAPLDNLETGEVQLTGASDFNFQMGAVAAGIGTEDKRVLAGLHAPVHPWP